MKHYTDDMRIAFWQTLDSYRKSIRDLQKGVSLHEVKLRWANHGSYTHCGLCQASCPDTIASPDCTVCPLGTGPGRPEAMPCVDETYLAFSRAVKSKAADSVETTEAMIARYMWLVNQGAKAGIV